MKFFQDFFRPLSVIFEIIFHRPVVTSLGRTVKIARRQLSRHPVVLHALAAFAFSRAPGIRAVTVRKVVPDIFAFHFCASLKNSAGQFFEKFDVYRVHAALFGGLKYHGRIFEPFIVHKLAEKIFAYKTLSDMPVPVGFACEIRL
jgi:hypothetical protein